MAKTYHVIRPATCSLIDIQQTLNNIAAVRGNIISVVSHSAPYPNVGESAWKAHNRRWCVIDIFYSKD